MLINLETILCHYESMAEHFKYMADVNTDVHNDDAISYRELELEYRKKAEQIKAQIGRGIINE